MNSKNFLILVVNLHLVLSTNDYDKDDRQNTPQFFKKLTKKHRPYSFEYGVNDEQTGTQFKRNENSDGKLVTGSYSIQLPDGRIQIVNYKADHNKGYQAEVTYQGEAKYPDHTNIKLSNPILLQPVLSYKGSDSNQQTLHLGKQEPNFNDEHHEIHQNYQTPSISNPVFQPPSNSYELHNHEDQILQNDAPNYPDIRPELTLPTNSNPQLPYQESQTSYQDPALNQPEFSEEDSVYSKFEPNDLQLETDYKQPELNLQNYPLLGQPQVPLHQQFESSYPELNPAHQLPSSDYLRSEPNIPIQKENNLELQENYQEPFSSPS